MADPRRARLLDLLAKKGHVELIRLLKAQQTLREEFNDVQSLITSIQQLREAHQAFTPTLGSELQARQHYQLRLEEELVILLNRSEFLGTELTQIHAKVTSLLHKKKLTTDFAALVRDHAKQAKELAEERRANAFLSGKLQHT